jgi:hypothetical protein
MIQGRSSGSVKVYSWVTTLGQQGTEAEPGRLGVFKLMYPHARRTRAAFYHLPEFVRVRGPRWKRTSWWTTYV